MSTIVEIEDRQVGKTYGPFYRDHETKQLDPMTPSIPEIGQLAAAHWCATEKLDGTSHRLILGLSGFTFKSRRDDKPSPHSAGALDVWELPDTLDFLTQHFKYGTCFYGELIGPKIQGNVYKLSSPQFRVFGATNPAGQWLDTDYVHKTFFDFNPNLLVPIIGYNGFDGTMEAWIRAVVLGTIASDINPEVRPEGVVLHLPGSLRMKGRPVLVKIKHKDMDKLFADKLKGENK